MQLKCTERGLSSLTFGRIYTVTRESRGKYVIINDRGRPGHYFPHRFAEIDDVETVPQIIRGDLVRHVDRKPFVGTANDTAYVHRVVGGRVELLGCPGTYVPSALVVIETRLTGKRADVIIMDEVGTQADQWDASRGPKMADPKGKAIFKYQMPVLEQFEMKLPAGALIIRMEDQGGMFWLWAVVDTRAPDETRKFRAFKTGASIPDNFDGKYVGFCKIQVQQELGLYIFEDVAR